MNITENIKFSSIDIGDLAGFAEPQSIRNFYLSNQENAKRLQENGTAFVFNGFSIGVCLKGQWDLRISGRIYCLTAGSLLILAPNQLIETVSTSDDLSTRSIIVSLDVILEHPSPIDINILNFALRKPVLKLPEDRMGRMLEYLDFLEKRYYETENAYREEISKTLLYALMLEICDIHRSASGDQADIPKPKQEQLTDDFLKLLMAHYRTEHNVAFYADKLNRTPKYLSEAIKRISGRSVPEWISTMLVSETKMLLKATDKTVLEISEELNFSSPSVFVQFFRHNTGITPLQYRKRL